MIGKNEPKVTQPSMDDQLAYLSLRDNDATEVFILGTKKRYLVRWLKNCQIVKLSRLLLRKGRVERPEANASVTTASRSATGSDSDDVLRAVVEDSKLACKAAAVILLDGFWSLHLRYWLLWRWFYYVKQYDDIQMKPIIDVGKKKVPRMEFLSVITSLTVLRDTLITMRTEEAEAILHEAASVRRGPSERSIPS